MGKKGQLTIFIIVALVVVAGVGGYFAVSNLSGDGEEETSYFKDDALAENIIDCFTEVYQSSLGVIGLQGGYYERDGEKLFTEYGFVPYYFNKGEVDFPKNEEVEIEIAKVVDDSIVECLDPSNYPGVELSFNSHSTSVKIDDKVVKFITDVTVDIKEGEKVRKIDFGETSVFIDSSLFYMIVIGQFSANYALDNDEKICLSCLNQLGLISDLFVEIIDMETDNNDFLFLVSTENVNEYPKVFEYMHSNENKVIGRPTVGGEE